MLIVLLTISVFILTMIGFKIAEYISNKRKREALKKRVYTIF